MIRRFIGEREVVHEGSSHENLDVGFPLWAGQKVFFESDVSEEESGVTVQGSDHLGSCNDFADVLKNATKCFWVLHAPNVEEVPANWDASAAKLFKIAAIPVVREITGIVRAELALEWPDWM